MGEDWHFAMAMYSSKRFNPVDERLGFKTGKDGVGAEAGLEMGMECANNERRQCSKV